MRKRIGLLGGTFNPIHLGHLEMAAQTQAALAPDEMILMPDGDPPHKTPQGATAADRLRMTELAAAGRFTVSRMELDRPGKTYTLDTLRALRAQGAEEIFMVIGADSLRDLPHWHCPEQVYELCTFAAFGRAGCEWPDAPAGAKVIRLEAQIPPFSSTEIRARVHRGLSIEGMTADAVADYIGAKRLYDPPRLLTDAEMRRKLQRTLNPKRYAHVLGVEETARRLANLYGVDESQARLAGLLHDCAKTPDTGRLLAWARQYEVDPALLPERVPAVWHGPVGEAVARAEYGVTDTAVLRAIRTHTTGCENMTPLDETLYVADLIEPSRTYPGVDEVRALAEKSLDEAVLAAMRQKLAYVIKSGSALDTRTARALKWLENKLSK